MSVGQCSSKITFFGVTGCSRSGRNGSEFSLSNSSNHSAPVFAFFILLSIPIRRNPLLHHVQQPARTWSPITLSRLRDCLLCHSNRPPFSFVVFLLQFCKSQSALTSDKPLEKAPGPLLATADIRLHISHKSLPPLRDTSIVPASRRRVCYLSSERPINRSTLCWEIS